MISHGQHVYVHVTVFCSGIIHTALSRQQGAYTRVTPAGVMLAGEGLAKAKPSVVMGGHTGGAQRGRVSRTCRGGAYRRSLQAEPREPVVAGTDPQEAGRGRQGRI